MPKSTFSKKIFFIYEKLEKKIDYKNFSDFKRFNSVKYKDRVRKNIYSFEHIIRNHLIRFFALSTPALIIFSLFYYLLIFEELKYHDIRNYATLEQLERLNNIENDLYTIEDSLYSFKEDVNSINDRDSLLNRLTQLNPSINDSWSAPVDSLRSLTLELGTTKLIEKRDSLDNLIFYEEARIREPDHADNTLLYLFLLFSTFLIIVFVYLRGLFSIKDFYKLKLIFFKNLYGKSTSALTLWQRLYLIRLIFQRWLILLSILIISIVILSTSYGLILLYLDGF